MCTILPVKKDSHSYAFAVMIVLNFLLFLLIAIGQLVIYLSVQSSKMSAHDNADTSTRKGKDVAVARRLFTVVMSDFVCWFPVGIMGILAAQCVSLPEQVNVALAIFVLPFNSALNPFLYTINVILEKRQKARELRLEKRLLAAMKK